MLPGLVIPPLRPVVDPRTLCNLREVNVLHALEWGAEQALQITELSVRAGISARDVQKVIDHLVFRHKVPVGTSMRAPYGNYLIETDEDLARSVQLFTRRGLHSLARASGLRRQSLKRYLATIQPELDLYLEDLR